MKNKKWPKLPNFKPEQGTIYNYGLPEKLISIIIKFRRDYLPKPEGLREIILSQFDNYGY